MTFSEYALRKRPNYSRDGLRSRRAGGDVPASTCQMSRDTFQS